MIPLVLASASPRRRALLEALGLSVIVQPSTAEESNVGSPETVVLTNARAKRDDALTRLSSPAVVIAADTEVFIDGTVLGKPTDLADAKRMLSMLSGRTHHVYTGLAVAASSTGKRAEAVEVTAVRFRELTAHEIERFVDAVRPLDRAGAYTVDGPGSLLVESYDGCFYNVLGLPIVRLDKLLRTLGHDLFARLNPALAKFL